MKEVLLDVIRCPICRENQLSVVEAQRNAVEIRQGQVTCLHCSTLFEIEDGILDLLVNPDIVIVNEQKGWTELEQMVVNTDEVMLALPDPEEEGHKHAWQSQSLNFHYMWSQLALRGDERVLDLGAGRCWTTRYFARRGCYAVGLDILRTKYVGLLTSDIYMQHEGIFFERMTGDMNDLPLRDGAFDLVFLNATIHHSSNLSAVAKEITRVLVPGGRVIFINEPSIGVFQSKELHCPEVEHGINENVYRLYEYTRALQQQGLDLQIFPYVGGYHRVLDRVNHLILKWFPNQVDRRIWPPLLYAQHFLFGGILNMIARKPTSTTK